jgi:hypothetical protein
MDELIYASAASLSRAIREKKVSSQEVVEAYIQRIEAVNPHLNAVVQLTAEAALAHAREADTALARGESKGPLHGVPITVKDSFDTEGIISTAGTKGHASYVPQQDATAVARMRAAGAIVLGKTNLPELSLAYESDNLIYGRTNNPYDLSRTPGGSSGGESAIIAAGSGYRRGWKYSRSRAFLRYRRPQANLRAHPVHRPAASCVRGIRARPACWSGGQVRARPELHAPDPGGRRLARSCHRSHAA